MSKLQFSEVFFHFYIYCIIIFFNFLTRGHGLECWLYVSSRHKSDWLLFILGKFKSGQGRSSQKGVGNAPKAVGKCQKIQDE